MFRKLSNEEYRLLTDDEKKKYNKDEQEYVRKQQFEDEEELLKLVDNSGRDDHGFQKGYRLPDNNIRLFLAALRLSSNADAFVGRGLLLEEKYPFVMIRKIK